MPGLMTGNVSSESMTDSEVVLNTMERLMKIVMEVREVDMRKKLKDYQNH